MHLISYLKCHIWKIGFAQNLFTMRRSSIVLFALTDTKSLQILGPMYYKPGQYGHPHLPGIFLHQNRKMIKVLFEADRWAGKV
ncbi:MAG: hypothetical protein A2V86_02925 [Deltaproteobacteria bacterium RBG_16_49_23]|nr:MAG: hypothetical protein A2V86_02925 [Deltaproteobacteria bacterium RBG_16_49_23]